MIREQWIRNDPSTTTISHDELLSKKMLSRILSRSGSAQRTVRSLSTKPDPSGQKAQVCAVLGAQWGDEGKGKLADVLASKGYDIVARFNGGNNAGHTLVVNGKRFAFHLLPCGLMYDHTLNLLGNGVVVWIQREG
jgi:Adenylosuccinate synthetase